MASSYIPLTTGQTPAYGTSGAAVAQFQADLNKKYNGQAGYTPLKVDGLYGPLTQAASAYKPGGAATTPTIGSVYQIPGNQDDGVDQAGRELDDYYGKLGRGESVVNEGKIRSDTLARFQAEIDATNALYAEKLNRARVTGQGRLGSDTAIQGRRGLLGSDFGNSQTEEVKGLNEDIYSGIEAEKATKIQEILGKARQGASEEIAARTKAIGEGLDAHLKYLGEAGERKLTKAQKAAQAIYDQDLSIDSLTPDELKKTAEAFGISIDDLKTAYVSVKKTGDAATTKAEQDARKALPASAQEYEYAKENGYKGTFAQYQNEDANRKARAGGNGPTGTLEERNQSTVQKVSALFSPGYTIPNSGGVPYVDTNGYATPEGFKIAIGASGLPRDTFIKQFGYLVAPGLENKYGITAVEKKLITG